MLFIILILLKLLTIIISIKYKLKYVGYYLIGNFIFDILGQAIKNENIYPKPYTGIGYVLFGGTTFCYLASAAWLLFLVGKSVSSKTIQQVAPLFFISVFSICLLFYPSLCGSSMLMMFYVYYIIACLVAIVAITNNFIKITINQALLLILSLGCLVEILLISLFKLYFFANLCNGMLYVVMIFFSLLNQKYERLLRR